MKVKIAVTDANIFIDLYNLGLINDFFNLEFEIHTTASVLMELYKKVLNIFLVIKKNRFIFANVN